MCYKLLIRKKKKCFVYKCLKSSTNLPPLSAFYSLWHYETKVRYLGECDGEDRSGFESDLLTIVGGNNIWDTDNLGSLSKKPTLDLRGVFDGARTRDGIGGASEFELRCWWSWDCLSGRGGGASSVLGSPFSAKEQGITFYTMPWFSWSRYRLGLLYSAIK